MPRIPKKRVCPLACAFQELLQGVGCVQSCSGACGGEGGHWCKGTVWLYFCRYWEFLSTVITSFFAVDSCLYFLDIEKLTFKCSSYACVVFDCLEFVVIEVSQNTCAHTGTYTCTHTNIQAHTQAYTHACTQAHTRAHTETRTQAHTGTGTCTHTRARTHTGTYTHTHP